jgi:TPR repeat protein
MTLKLSFVSAIFILFSMSVSAQELACDQLAASPHDAEKVTAGVLYKNIDPKLAINVCKDAVEKNKKNGRLWFQYGRALEKGNKVADAIIAYQEAIKFNHAAAFNNMGELYRDGKGFEKNPVKAEEFFSKAAQYGSTEGVANLNGNKRKNSVPATKVNEAAIPLVGKLKSSSYSNLFACVSPYGSGMAGKLATTLMQISATSIHTIGSALASSPYSELCKIAAVTPGEENIRIAIRVAESGNNIYWVADRGHASVGFIESK